MFEQILAQDSILESRQIHIPNYPQAYNPSLIPYKSGYLLSFRFISRYPEALKNDLRNDVSFIGLVQLDQEFEIIPETVQLLNIISHSSHFSLTVEDARLLTVNGRIFIFFNDLAPPHVLGKHAMYFGELTQEQTLFELKGPAIFLNYSRAIHIEKNWTPFSSDGKLYVIYSDQPRVILEIDEMTGACEEISRTNVDWDWSFGQIRGGTPACLVEDEFLTFFHSSFPSSTPKGRTFMMGAYTFDPETPFSIRAVTAKPLGNLVDYTKNNAPKVIFPGGIVVEGDRIHVAFGKADNQIFITTFDRKKLLSSMRSDVSCAKD